MVSRLSPLGVLTALLVFLPLLCGGSRALAADWDIQISSGLPASDGGYCNPNSTFTATKTVTVTATLRWTGTGSPPSQVIVNEAASLSWSAEVHRAHNGETIGEDPSPPDGSVTKGTCSTGLTDVVTENPNQTAYSKGQSIAGTREQKLTVPTNGTVVLPSVTVTATATATSTGIGTTGSANVDLGSYSVNVPVGSAHASASFDMNPGSGSDWSRDRFFYSGPAPDGTIFKEQGSGYPKISVDLAAAGMSEVDKTVTVVQLYATDVYDPDVLRIYGSRTAEGNISSHFFSSSSSSDGAVSGSAPNGTDGMGLIYNEVLTTYSGTSPGIIVAADPPSGGTTGGRTARYTLILKAKASTDL